MSSVVPFLFCDIQSIEASVKSIVLPDWICNDQNCIEFDFSRFFCIESIEIGDGNFEFVKTFKIDGLNRLKTIKIGNNSFLNCESLESIEIGEYSFSDFGGEFELKNLPQLQSIQTVDNCFGSVKTFKIDGLNRLKTIKIGKNSFTLLKESNWNYRKANTQSKSFHILNCESLESIQIGESHNFYGSSFVIRGIAMTTDI